jgi:hypothetical protein
MMKPGRAVPHVVAPVASAGTMVVELVASRLVSKYLGSSRYPWTSVLRDPHRGPRPGREPDAPRVPQERPIAARALPAARRPRRTTFRMTGRLAERRATSVKPARRNVEASPGYRKAAGCVCPASSG